MTTELAVTGMIFVPLSAAILAFVLGRRMAIVLALIAAAAQAWLVALVTRAILVEGPVRYALGGWGAPLGIDLRVDGLAALMLIMTTVVGMAITVYAVGYFSAGHGKEKGGSEAGQAFWPLWLFTWAALNAVFLSGDIFNLYVTLELLTLAAVALIGLAGQVTALAAALRYLMVALVGSMFYLLGVALLYAAYGTLDWELLGEAIRSDGITWLAAALMTAGLALKTALCPLHFWLPPAHANAPAPVSALLSGLVLKASLFMLLRLWFYSFRGLDSPYLGQLLALLGAAGILWGSAEAIRQGRVKLMVAYSSVAQVGYLFLLFSLATGPMPMLAWRGTVYFAMSHACAKAAAFMAAGTLAQAAGTDELHRWEGIAHREPAAVFAFGLAGVSLMSLPPSGGFIGKWLLLDAALGGGQWPFAVVMLLGGLLAAIYVFRVVARSLSTEALPATRDVPAIMRWTPLALALVAILMGVFAMQPLQLLEIGTAFPRLEQAP